MKSLSMMTAVLAVLVATPALAEPETQIKTFDGPKVSATQSVSKDQAAGTVSRDAEIVRKSDGATATRSVDRTRTENGLSASGTRTGFDGKTSSFALERVRNPNGATTTGTATARNGEVFSLSGNRQRTESGFNANQSITNSTGTRVFSRDVGVSRSNGQVNRSVNVTRAEGFKPRKRTIVRPGRRR